jgi:hypothetical protein
VKDIENPLPAKKKSGSWFTKFFILEDGVISLSLRDLTIIICITTSVTLLTMGYLSCTDGTFVCNTERLPMISGVIISNEMYDRIFLLLTTIMMFGVMQVNVRAFYKKLYGIIPDSSNDSLFDLGIIACFALPCVGIFDEKSWKILHVISAGFFFACFGFYSFFLGRHLYNNISKFPEAEQRSIKMLSWHTWGLIFSLVMFCVTPLLPRHAFLNPLFEWITVLYYANFFAFASVVNPFYDSVHQEGTLVPKKK